MIVAGPAPCGGCGTLVWLDLRGVRERGVARAAAMVEAGAVTHACPAPRRAVGSARRAAKNAPGAKA